MSICHYREIDNIMSKLSVNSDLKRGKRLEKILEDRFPGRSWLSRSQELGVNNSTVIGWRQGREISNHGISRLLELGCDVLWLLTGKDGSGKNASGQKPEAKEPASDDLHDFFGFLTQLAGYSSVIADPRKRQEVGAVIYNLNAACLALSEIKSELDELDTSQDDRSGT